MILHRQGGQDRQEGKDEINPIGFFLLGVLGG
jgi:hypothetical protein